MRTTSTTRAARDNASRVDDAIEVFVDGFCFTRSLTHPYISQRVGPLWVMRDAPRKNGDYRNEEWVTHGVDPEQVGRIVKENARGRHFLCVIRDSGEPEEPLRKAYRALGYRLMSTESLMVHRLKPIPTRRSPAIIERVTTLELAEQVRKAAGYSLIGPGHLNDDPPMRVYAALVDSEVVGFVRSILTLSESPAGSNTWCASMFVASAFRRRGIGGALVCRMLRDDRARGASSSVLQASHAGAALYATVGYETVGTTLVYVPKRPR